MPTRSQTHAQERKGKGQGLQGQIAAQLNLLEQPAQPLRRKPAKTRQGLVADRAARLVSRNLHAVFVKNNGQRKLLKSCLPYSQETAQRLYEKARHESSVLDVQVVTPDFARTHAPDWEAAALRLLCDH